MSVQDLLTQAEQIEKKAQWAQAADLYRSVLENSPNNIVAREKLGWCLSREGDYEGAIVVFQEVIEIQPNIAKWPYMIGYQYYGQQQWREAIEWFSKSLDLNPKYIAVLYRKGYAHFKLGELGECLQSFETCRSLWHELPEGALKEKNKKKCAKAAYYQAHIILDNPRKIDGGIEGAIPLINESIELDPRNHYALYILGKLLMEIGKTEEAISAFQNADKLKPGQDYILDRLGQALAKLDRLKEAEEIYKTLVANRPKDYILRNLGKIQYEAKDFFSAIHTFKKAIQRNHRNHIGHCYLGLCYKETGEWSLSLSELRKAIDLKEKYFKRPYLEVERVIEEILAEHPDAEKKKEKEIPLRGKVSKYFSKKGYGFIRGKREKDIFFHISDCLRKEEISTDILVEYEEGVGDKGLPKAINIKPII
jgi:tetratricopeptide (TPR) repeat protein